jgi:transcriptional adapter 2-beta
LIAGRHTWKEAERSKTKDHTQINPLLPPPTPNEPPPNLTLNESIMLGYLGKRDDFEMEYDNECENLVSQLDDDYPTSSSSGNNGSGLSEDDELMKALNIAHVEAYKVKLRERDRRKRVARDHNLVGKIIWFLKCLQTNQLYNFSRKTQFLAIENP